MNTDIPHSSRVPLAESDIAYGTPSTRTVSWGAIFAGMSAAIALQALLMMLGAGLGFAIYHPLTEQEPIADLGKGFVVIQGISAVFALWFGGWVAGRFTPAGIRGTGWLHGFSVWCASTVAGIALVAGGAGWALGDLSKAVGGGLSMAGQPAAAAVSQTADMAKDAVKQNADLLGGFTEETLGLRSNVSPAEAIRAKRDTAAAVARYFNPMQEDKRAANRQAVIGALTKYGNLSNADAERTLNEWTASYDQLKRDLAEAKDQAEAKARQAAEEASQTLTIYSLCMFAAFAIGAFSAAFGGSNGAKCARRYEERMGNLPM